MNRKLGFSLVTFLFFSACAALAQTGQQPLGDYARAVKKTNPPAASDQKKVYDNDNLPTTGPVSVVGSSSATSTSDPAKDAASAATPSADDKEKADNKEKKDAPPEIKPGQSMDERKKAIDAWKDKYASQSDKIAKLSHELDLLQSEYRVKAADFYANTANRAQNPTGFAKEDADYKQQIAEKQKALDAEKAKLSDIQEQSRRAGVPDSAFGQN